MITHHCYEKIDIFVDFSCDIDYNIGQTYLEMLSP